MKDIPGLAAIHRKHADVIPEPMFEMRPKNTEPAPKAKPKRTVDSRICPTCKAAKVGTIYEQDRSGRVQVFREHYRVTYGGHRFRCTESGADASGARRVT